MSRPSGLLGIDIDGTLITDHGKITEPVHQALVRAAESGWEIVPASGRTYFAAKPLIGNLPFVTHAVLSNGSTIVDMRDESVSHMEKLSSGQVAEAVRITRERGAIPALYSSDIHRQKIYYDTLENASDYFIRYVTEDPRVERVGDVTDHIGDILQIGVIAPRETILDLGRALAVIDATVMTLPFESPRYGGKIMDYWFIQVVAKDARKIIALRKLALTLDIPAGRLVAVGDNYNDIDMLANADVGVAMGNAPDEVKARAAVVVASNNDHGIAEVVDTIILSGAYFS